MGGLIRSINIVDGDNTYKLHLNKDTYKTITQENQQNQKIKTKYDDIIKNNQNKEESRLPLIDRKVLCLNKCRELAREVINSLLKGDKPEFLKTSGLYEAEIQQLVGIENGQMPNLQNVNTSTLCYSFNKMLQGPSVVNGAVVDAPAMKNTLLLSIQEFIKSDGGTDFLQSVKWDDVIKPFPSKKNNTDNSQNSN